MTAHATSQAAPSGAIASALDRSSATSPHAAPAAQAAQPRNWSVQVGEFASGRLATRQVDYVADAFRAQFDDREGQVDHVGRSYRAVFTGFTQAEAQQACATVEAKAQPCVAAPR